MKLSVLHSWLLSILLFSLLHKPSFAVKKSYIVYLGAHTHGLEPTAADLDRVTDSHYDLLGSALGSKEKVQEKIFYSYNRNINGFAALLEEEEAAEVAKNPNVVSVFLNEQRELHTTRTWEFLGLETDGVTRLGSIWKKARFGEDVIIGNLDTGVWPESKSFNDEGMGPIPTRWRGICQKGIKDGLRCNRKLIGARYFNKGFAASVGKLNATFQSARDHDGHGSHTLSTAGGSFVPGANVFGYGNGTAKGGSPKARVAAYKVCWPGGTEGGCYDADIMAALEAAISDGVDVISLSVGGDPREFFSDAMAIGAFHAVEKGIVVVTSAGNSGPAPYTVSNVSPWMITVGASTIDREFISYISLGNKNVSHAKNLHFKGLSLSKGALPSQKFYTLITGAAAKSANAAEEDAQLCKPEALDRKKVKGKILVCLRGDTPRVDKSYQASLAGAVAMILANDEESGNELIADPHFLPASHITFSDGQMIFDYINSTKNPNAYLTRVRTLVNTKPAPFMAAFSSRGPNLIEPSLLKPDITAPGVTVIAAYTQAVGPADQEYDKRRTPFATESGTSMSCPHISGIVGLLRSLHPDWSPAAIQSALMTTATIRSNRHEPILDSDKHKATPFAYGAGHVRPNRAMNPGLVYDLSIDDYLNFLCARGYNKSKLKHFTHKSYVCPKSSSLSDFNYPSISIPLLNGTATVTRRLKNVDSPATYTAYVKAPEGVLLSVFPSSLKFEKTGEEKAFKVVLKTVRGAGKPDEFLSGRLTWTDGKHYVRSPIALVKRV